jgi:plastocyanin
VVRDCQSTAHHRSETPHTDRGCIHRLGQQQEEEGNAMRVFVPALLMVSLSLGVWACGSSYSADPVSPAPTPIVPPATTPGGAVTIDILFENGAQSFSPNPATLSAGQMVVWHNVDRVTHRVVLNNGSLDTGNLGPGAFSQPMPINTPGPYHCSIHPSMVGTISAMAFEAPSAGDDPEPPSSGDY